MAYLPWISDDDLVNAVKFLLAKAAQAKTKANKKFGKNVIDPFSAMFEMSGFGLSFDDWVKSEMTRQAQKTLQNHIGDFHQNVLGNVQGWENKRTGNVIDLVSEGKQIIAEVKNKYNTVSGGKLSDLYRSLDDLVMPKSSIYKGYTAYYVAIIPKTNARFDIPFTPSDKGKGERCRINELIRYADGSTFYHLVTGDTNALEQLYDVLPKVISDCSGGKFSVADGQKLKQYFNSAFS